MASSFAMSETYGAGSGTTTDTSYLNLLAASVASGADATTAPAANPIALPGSGTNYSFERYFRAHWTSTFTSISSITFFKQAGSLGTGIGINCGTTGNGTYTAAVNTASSVATAGIPTSSGSAIAFGPTSLTSAGYSYYGVMQMTVASTASSGVVATQTYRFAWQEV
jgi:hypothetical protein